MNGRVDQGGRALVQITLKAVTSSEPSAVEAWIDTGFTGDLVLPATMIANLGLSQSGTVSAELGDGSDVVLSTFTCSIDWFGSERQIEIVSNNGQVPLLGVGLLRDHKLVVDYSAQAVTIE